MKQSARYWRFSLRILGTLACCGVSGCEIDNALDTTTSSDPDAGGDAEVAAFCETHADGVTCAHGKYCLDGRCSLPRCGDGFVGESEECDDGNTRSRDGCSTKCRAEYTCGDGDLEPGEQCDDGNSDSHDGCSAQCQTESVCGNGKLEPDEACDDHNTKSGDGCSMRCAFETNCGDAQLAAEEECDDGNTKSGDGCSSVCHQEICGDGRSDGIEECDDGNTEGGDGCSPSCECEADCGNGSIECAEQCDDSNQLNGDGCSRKCELEYCGDDFINNGNEECDNGAANGEQGCSKDCRVACTSCLEGCEACRETCPAAAPNPELGLSGDYLKDCFAAEGNAKEGPKAGARKAVLCAELVECLYHTGCASSHWLSCLCGEGVDPNSAACAENLQGACVEQFAAGAESQAAASIKERALDPRYALGRAIRLFESCDAPHCLPSCMPEGCGNGKLETGEECDDGERVSKNDGCSPLCRLECGDAELQGPLVGGDEECDDGNRESQDGCSATCKKEGACGDGTLTPPEECDDANGVPLDGCNALCKLEFCGDSIINDALDGVAREECDGATLPATAPPGSSCEACQLVQSTCGNGSVDVGEECDPPNTETCDASCQLQRCGNGSVEADKGETCDDGNRTSGDGCTALCILEKCGDGVINNASNGEPSSEECDDGGNVDGDGCSAACKREQGTPCEECMLEKCAAFVDGCNNPATGAPADYFPSGPEQCREIIACAMSERCAFAAADGVSKEECYCGKIDAGNSIGLCIALDGRNLDGTFKGPCGAEIEAGAGSDLGSAPGDKGTKVSERLVDPRYPVGNAFRWINCAYTYDAANVSNCKAECEQ